MFSIFVGASPNPQVKLSNVIFCYLELLAPDNKQLILARVRPLSGVDPPDLRRIRAGSIPHSCYLHVLQNWEASILTRKGKSSDSL